MKTRTPHTTIRRTAALFVIAVIAGFMTAQEARSVTLYAGTNETNGWTAARWSTNAGGPFTSAWQANADTVFQTGGTYLFGAAGSGFTVGNIMVENNATVKFTNNGSTMGGNGNVRTVTVGDGSVLDLLNQTMSTGANNGWIKEGSGVWAMAGATNLNGSFVLNGGTIVMRGVNTMGGGTNSTLTLSNGTVAANADRAVPAGKYGGGMTIAGDIQFGALSNAYAANAQYLINDTANISFGDDVSLKGATRTVTIGGNGNYTFSGVISNGGLIVTNATNATGKLILSGANTYSGGTVIKGGTLQIGANATTGSVVGDITNNARLSVSRSDNITWTNAITGSGSFEQAGSGVLTFTNDNTYTNGTLISAGTLSLGNGGTGGSVAGTITNNSKLLVNHSDNITFSNVISGTGTFTNIGTGTTTFTADNTYTGLTTINSGALSIGNGGTTGSVAGAVTNDGATLIFNRSDNVTINTTNIIRSSAGSSLIKQGAGTLTLAASQVNFNGGLQIDAGTLNIGGGVAGTTLGTIDNITNNGVLVFQRNSGSTYSGTISGTGSLIQLGNNLALYGDNTYTGDTIISNSVLTLGSGGTSGSVAGKINIAASGATLRVNRSDTLTLSKEISGNGKLEQGGSGTTKLTADNTNYTGNISITNGTLQIGDGGTSGTAGTGNITNNATLAIKRSDSYTLGNLISGTGSLQQIGTGTTILTNANTYSGGTLISSGGLQLGNGGTTGTIAGPITNNATLAVNRSDSYTLTNVISGTGSLQQVGTGTTTLTNANTYSGGTLISSGALSIGNGGASGAVGTGNITNNATLFANRSDNFTISSVISGSGAFVKTGSGTTTLTGENTYAGLTTISNGAISIGDGGTTGSIAGTITNRASTLIFNRSDNVAITNANSLQASSTAALIKKGGGTLTLAANQANLNGSIQIDAGTLNIGGGVSGTSLGSISGITNNSKLEFERVSGSIVNYVISGSGTTETRGSSTVQIASSNSYTGGTVISDTSTLTLGSSTGSYLTGSVDGKITNNATLNVARANDFTMTNEISGTGAFGKSQAGKTTLTANNTFTGATTVSAGILELNATSGSALGGTTNVSVASGATLLLSKSSQVNNAAKVTLSGGTIQRGAGVSETFSDLNLTAASLIDFGAAHGPTDLGTLTFGTYTPSSLLTVSNFFEGNVLVFKSDLSSTIHGALFSFDNGFTSSWDSGSSTFTITAIPEPSAYLALAALIGLMLWPMRKRLRASRCGE